MKCKKEFYKKYSHSKNYWLTAKFCSVSCGRLSYNPAKLKPNQYKIVEDKVIIFVNSKGITYEYLVDKKVYFENKDIYSTRWSVSSYGYLEACITIGQKHKKKYLHKIIMPSKKGLVVDHINGNTRDNRLSNLRYLTHIQNIRNQRIKNPIGINNARILHGKIYLRFKLNNREISLGRFNSLEKAKEARIKAEEKYWGQSFLKEKLIK